MAFGMNLLGIFEVQALRKDHSKLRMLGCSSRWAETLRCLGTNGAVFAE
jgi:hypothetical protein